MAGSTRRSLAPTAIAALVAALIAACGGSGAGNPPSGAPTDRATSGATTVAAEAPRAAVGEGATDSVGVAIGSEAADGSRLIVTIDDEDAYIVNGGRINLGSGTAAELYIDPYPPTTLRAVLDVYLEQGGEPVLDGHVGIEYDMLAMVHGPFVGSAESIGGGHYLMQLDYIMFGAWDQLLTIRAGDHRIELPLIVVARP